MSSGVGPTGPELHTLGSGISPTVLSVPNALSDPNALERTSPLASPPYVPVRSKQAL